MPLSPSDTEYAAVQAAAAIHPRQRGDFLKALATELERHPVFGPGLVHRLAAELQMTFGVEAHGETSLTHAQRARQAGGRRRSGPRRAVFIALAASFLVDTLGRRSRRYTARASCARWRIDS
jgi:hypothetical protein